MKKRIINMVMKYIKKRTKYNKTELLEIEYGLTGIYLTFSKIIIISILSAILGILKEMAIFMIIFNIIRTTAFGLHATKSWICLISSLTFFILLPIVCIYIHINLIGKIIIGLLSVLLIFKNAPADTYKRPIVSKKRRLVLKIISTCIAICFVVISLIIKNNFLSNSFLFTLVLENCLISPYIYRLFNLPYNNYITYIKKHPEIVK